MVPWLARFDCKNPLIPGKVLINVSIINSSTANPIEGTARIYLLLAAANKVNLALLTERRVSIKFWNIKNFTCLGRVVSGFCVKICLSLAACFDLLITEKELARDFFILLTT